MRRRRSTWRPSRVLVLVAQAGGIEAAKKFVGIFGGRRIFVPRLRIDDSHELVIALGRAAASALRDEFGGESLIVPVGRDLQLDLAAEAIGKVSVGHRHAIVRALGVSYPTAKRILRKLKSAVPAQGAVPARRKDPRQIDIEDLLASK